LAPFKKINMIATMRSKVTRLAKKAEKTKKAKKAI
jgi:hypothetical protein